MISVASDQQWTALQAALGTPEWADKPEYVTVEGRRRNHDALDAELARWCATGNSFDVVDQLAAAGVPASVVLRQDEPEGVPQLRARGFLETVEHSIVGSYTQIGYPARLQSGPTRHNRSAAPTLGQHNPEILTQLAGLTATDLERLAETGVIGTRPGGPQSAW
jgi:crotonobetainyl-CoA:carnitine CoA-transferase CaiB-like acyl-CoA transferase